MIAAVRPDKFWIPLSDKDKFELFAKSKNIRYKILDKLRPSLRTFIIGMRITPSDFYLVQAHLGHSAFI